MSNTVHMGDFEGLNDANSSGPLSPSLLGATWNAGNIDNQG
jgi:hypothetical protein